jgi:hypothetical protein
MALEPIFRELSVSLHKLNDALQVLHLTVGDKPQHDEAALADYLESTVLDTMESLHEALKAAGNAQQTVEHPAPDLDRARRQLTLCQDRFDRVAQQIASNLAAHEKLKELERLGAKRGGEWLPWANSMKQGIEQCSQPLNAASQALVRCWQEMVDHLVTALLGR